MLGFLEVSCIMMAGSLYPDLQVNIPNNDHTFDLCAKMETDTACAINQDSLDSLEVQVESKRKREAVENGPCAQADTPSPRPEHNEKILEEAVRAPKRCRQEPNAQADTPTTETGFEGDEKALHQHDVVDLPSISSVAQIPTAPSGCGCGLRHSIPSVTHSEGVASESEAGLHQKNAKVKIPVDPQSVQSEFHDYFNGMMKSSEFMSLNSGKPPMSAISNDRLNTSEGNKPKKSRTRKSRGDDKLLKELMRDFGKGGKSAFNMPMLEFPYLTMPTMPSMLSFKDPPVRERTFKDLLREESAANMPKPTLSSGIESDIRSDKDFLAGATSAGTMLASAKPPTIEGQSAVDEIMQYQLHLREIVRKSKEEMAKLERQIREDCMLLGIEPMYSSSPLPDLGSMNSSLFGQFGGIGESSAFDLEDNTHISTGTPLAGLPSDHWSGVASSSKMPVAGPSGLQRGANASSSSRAGPSSLACEGQQGVASSSSSTGISGKKQTHSEDPEPTYVGKGKGRAF